MFFFKILKDCIIQSFVRAIDLKHWGYQPHLVGFYLPKAPARPRREYVLLSEDWSFCQVQGLQEICSWLSFCSAFIFKTCHFGRVGKFGVHGKSNGYKLLVSVDHRPRSKPIYPISYSVYIYIVHLCNPLHIYYTSYIYPVIPLADMTITHFAEALCCISRRSFSSDAKRSSCCRGLTGSHHDIANGLLQWNILKISKKQQCTMHFWGVVTISKLLIFFQWLWDCTARSKANKSKPMRIT